MNILYDSRCIGDKSPFGPVWAGQACRVRVRVPAECGARRVTLTAQDLAVELARRGEDGPYHVFAAAFTPDTPGLYFYKFHIWDKNGDYDLYKAGDGTNIGEGELWQLSVLPADYVPPESYAGRLGYATAG